MKLIGAAAQHLLYSHPRTIKKYPPFKSAIVQLAFSALEPYSTYSTPFRRKRTCLLDKFAAQGTIPICRRIAIGFPRTRRDYATAPIVQRFRDLPRKYRDKHGLPFRATPFSQGETLAIFGPGVEAIMANRTMKILHGRRVAGTLSDPDFGFQISGVDDQIQAIALSWLRKNVPVDEEDSAVQRAEMELAVAEAEAEAEAQAECERLGIYKPNSGRVSPGKGGGGTNDIYGEGILDAMRETNKRRRLLREKEEAAQKKETDGTQSSSTNLLTTGKSHVELETPRKEHPWKTYYLERAKVLPETVPDWSAWQRLWPTGAVTLLTIGISVVFAMAYTPPTREVRLWPDMPPAAATMTALVLMNTAIYVLWHFPPALRLLNKYFISVPGYPRALASLGAVFSHHSFTHLLSNMALLWVFGTRLHDEVGRGNFLAIYLSAGVFSCFSSLCVFTYLRNFTTSSLGASGSCYGVLAALLWLHRYDGYKFLGFPPDPMPGAPGMLILALVLLFDAWNVRKVGRNGYTIDHYTHLGGLAAGVVSGEILERRARERQRLELERRRKMALIGQG